MGGIGPPDAPFLATLRPHGTKDESLKPAGMGSVEEEKLLVTGWGLRVAGCELWLRGCDGDGDGDGGCANPSHQPCPELAIAMWGAWTETWAQDGSSMLSSSSASSSSTSPSSSSSSSPSTSSSHHYQHHADANDGDDCDLAPLTIASEISGLANHGG
ncbi:hypothetical protein K493DRAFT_303949 [Basidiobolus meristosporus CBS 931.73]|uniref:Uncharacterized protein n=1 Tax=Basidiobolus meristosporus CBS 931.73 TaxID=1314790 RepID=A0A1Y1Y0Q3_9FUNG|nr:hypothetical protein K493DRAFT_303949 [Basidiobolus meristosporus CBS 931.73]|eukprot:ORX91583.1 hypothetical protein K493DRAFT_303949 [Basidiobolus meristosporus CBS 931.73]